MCPRINFSSTEPPTQKLLRSWTTTHLAYLHLGPLSPGRKLLRNHLRNRFQACHPFGKDLQFTLMLPSADSTEETQAGPVLWVLLLLVSDVGGSGLGSP